MAAAMKSFLGRLRRPRGKGFSGGQGERDSFHEMRRARVALGCVSMRQSLPMPDVTGRNPPRAGKSCSFSSFSVFSDAPARARLSRQLNRAPTSLLFGLIHSQRLEAWAHVSHPSDRPSQPRSLLPPRRRALALPSTSPRWSWRRDSAFPSLFFFFLSSSLFPHLSQQQIRRRALAPAGQTTTSWAKPLGCVISA